MSNEITVSAMLSYLNSPLVTPAISLPVSNVSFSITGKNFLKFMMTVPTTAGGTAIPITQLANVGWGIFYNVDPTNYCDILTAVSGTAFARLQMGAPCLVPFSPNITAPAALAHTAAVQLEIFVLEI